MQDPIEEIRTRLTIEEVVQPYVSLKKAGRNFKACCPFHKEKTPSFVVSPEKQLAYCFGCHKGGDMFKFIQEAEGVDFRGALEILADKANVELKAGPGPRVSKDEKDTYVDLQKELSDFYSKNLYSKDGKKVLEYIKDRGVTDESIKEWGIGFAKDSFEAGYKHLLSKNFHKSDAVKTGVLISKDTSGDKVYDRFRLRLIFPIFDDMGRVVGFGGRALKKGDEPKYLNSPDSPVYNKSKVLYGLNLAKEHIKSEDLAVVVEGYMDVISSYQSGIKNVVASSGTALTDGQLKLLKRFTKNIAFCFDTDAAGRDALNRAIESAQPLDLNLKIVLIPGYKDPDECCKDDPSKWRDAIENAKYYLDFYLENSEYDVSDLEQSKAFCDMYLGLLSGVKHPLEQETYLNKLASKVSVPA
ncbi:DNA primase, partial [Patescibacteria group bacterium]|nr:DNA primase [Patescibacteria group bacterium]